MICDFAEQIPFEGPDGGAFVGAPYRGVLHTVEAMTFNPSTKTYYGHRNPPHFTLDWEEDNGVARLWQHYDTDRAARALENRPGGSQTNRQNAIQIEIVWRAAQINDMPVFMWVALHGWMRWCEEHHDIQPFCPRFGGSDQYGRGNELEISHKDWKGFNGWCGHQHVPENSHWDPGAISPEALDALGLTIKDPKEIQA